MTERRGRTILAALVLVSLLLVTMDYRAGTQGPLAALQRGVLTVFAPLQEGFATVVSPIGGVFSSIGNLGGLRAENERLAAEVEQLRVQQRSQADLERRVADLEAQLGIAQRPGLSVQGARVLGRPVTGSAYSVLIDVGADQGIAAGMAVLNQSGLVGKVAEVTPSLARVQLVTDPGAGGYAVRLAATGERGLLGGRGTQPYELELADEEVVVPAEAEIVTHAFPGSTIPDGLPVGVVADGGTGPSLAVSPYVDFSRLSTVVVVTDYPPPPPDVDRAQIVPAPAGERPDPPADSDDPDGAGDLERP